MYSKSPLYYVTLGVGWLISNFLFSSPKLPIFGQGRAEIRAFFQLLLTSPKLMKSHFCGGLGVAGRHGGGGVWVRHLVSVWGVVNCF